MKILIKENQFYFLIEQVITHSEGMDEYLRGYLMGMLFAFTGTKASKQNVKSYFTPNAIISATDYIVQYFADCNTYALLDALREEGLFKTGYNIFINRASKTLGFDEEIYGKETRNELIKPSKPLELSRFSITKKGLIDYKPFSKN